MKALSRLLLTYSLVTLLALYLSHPSIALSDDGLNEEAKIARSLIEAWDVKVSRGKVTVQPQGETTQANCVLVIMPFGVEIGQNDDRVQIHSLDNISQAGSGTFEMPRRTRCYIVAIKGDGSSQESLWAKIPFKTLDKRCSSLITLAENYLQSGSQEKAIETYAKALAAYPNTKVAKELRSELERKSLLQKVEALMPKAEIDPNDYGVRKFEGGAEKILSVLNIREKELKAKQKAEAERLAKLRNTKLVVSSYATHLRMLAEDDKNIQSLKAAVASANRLKSVGEFRRAESILGRSQSANAENAEIEDYVAQALALAKEEDNTAMFAEIADRLKAITNNKSESLVMRSLASDSLRGSTKTKDALLKDLQRAVAAMPRQFKGTYTCPGCNGSGLLPPDEIRRLQSTALAGAGTGVTRINIKCRNCNGATTIKHPTIRWSDGTTTPLD